MKKAYCKESSPMINNFLIGYAKELGLRINIIDEKGICDYPHIGYYDTVGVCRVSNEFQAEPLSLPDFIGFLQGIEPKLDINGNEVQFNKGYIRVGCTTVTNELVRKVVNKLID